MIKKQFYHRLWHELRRKWSALRSVTDWTVALYIVVPIFIFSGMYYHSLWKETLSIEKIAYFYLGFMIFYMLTYGRGVRSFLEQADSLFLIRYPSYMKQFLKYGMLYTCIRIGITNFLVTVLMLPLFVRTLHASLWQILLFWMLLTMFRFMCALAIRYIDLHIGKHWISIIIKNTLFFIGTLCLGTCMLFVFTKSLYTIVYAILFVSISFWLIKVKMKYKHNFYMEVEKEREESMRWTTGIMQAGGQIAKPSRNATPWMFPRSKRVLGKSSESRIVESFLKEYFRSNTSLVFYIQIVVVSAIGLIITPSWIAAIVVMFSCYAIIRYSRDYWNEFTKKMFLQLYCKEEELLWIRGKVNRYLLLPALIIYGVIITAHFYLLPAITIGGLFLLAGVWVVFVPSFNKT
ncbi:ABC transporter permease [Bacillus manliponensis]|uniref:ABC transporter permease n=1 Tax=Bacillus manliponensis TaxID=574376 RepID=UPI0035116127